jgi:hypothetical protein
MIPCFPRPRFFWSEGLSFPGHRQAGGDRRGNEADPPDPARRKIRGFELTPDAHALILYERTAEADIWLVTGQ